MSDETPQFLPDLIARSQDRDVELAEQQYLQDKAAREELWAKSHAKSEVNISQLLNQMYGEKTPDKDAAVPVMKAVEPKKETNGKPIERFPVPPTTSRR